MSFPEVLSPGQLRFRLDREFGPAEARALVELLATVSPGSHLSFDFSRVREFQDRAIGALAQLLARLPGAEVTFHGLPLHQRRMLRYFGVDVETRNEGPQRDL